MAVQVKNRRFPTAYKIKAIKRVERGDGVLPVARELGISRKILHDLIKAWKADGPDGLNRKRGPKPGEAEGFSDPKDGETWVPNPNPGKGGSKYGWQDDKGRVWCPTGPGRRAHGGPHWDVQLPGGGYVNVRPGQNIND